MSVHRQLSLRIPDQAYSSTRPLESPRARRDQRSAAPSPSPSRCVPFSFTPTTPVDSSRRLPALSRNMRSTVYRWCAVLTIVAICFIGIVFASDKSRFQVERTLDEGRTPDWEVDVDMGVYWRRKREFSIPTVIPGIPVNTADEGPTASDAAPLPTNTDNEGSAPQSTYTGDDEPTATDAAPPPPPTSTEDVPTTVDVPSTTAYVASSTAEAPTRTKVHTTSAYVPETTSVSQTPKVPSTIVASDTPASTSSDVESTSFLTPTTATYSSSITSTSSDYAATSQAAVNPSTTSHTKTKHLTKTKDLSTIASSNVDATGTDAFLPTSAGYTSSTSTTVLSIDTSIFTVSSQFFSTSAYATSSSTSIITSSSSVLASSTPASTAASSTSISTPPSSSSLAISTSSTIIISTEAPTPTIPRSLSSLFISPTLSSMSAIASGFQTINFSTETPIPTIPLSLSSLFISPTLSFTSAIASGFQTIYFPGASSTSAAVEPIASAATNTSFSLPPPQQFQSSFVPFPSTYDLPTVTISTEASSLSYVMPTSTRVFGSSAVVTVPSSVLASTYTLASSSVNSPVLSSESAIFGTQDTNGPVPTGPALIPGSSTNFVDTSTASSFSSSVFSSAYTPLSSTEVPPSSVVASEVPSNTEAATIITSSSSLATQAPTSTDLPSSGAISAAPPTTIISIAPPTTVFVTVQIPSLLSTVTLLPTTSDVVSTPGAALLPTSDVPTSYAVTPTTPAKQTSSAILPITSAEALPSGTFTDTAIFTPNPTGPAIPALSVVPTPSIVTSQNGVISPPDFTSSVSAGDLPPPEAISTFVGAATNSPVAAVTSPVDAAAASTTASILSSYGIAYTSLAVSVPPVNIPMPSSSSSASVVYIPISTVVVEPSSASMAPADYSLTTFATLTKSTAPASSGPATTEPLRNGIVLVPAYPHSSALPIAALSVASSASEPSTATGTEETSAVETDMVPVINHEGVFTTNQGAWSSETEMDYSQAHGGLPGADIRSSGVSKLSSSWAIAGAVGMLGALVLV